MSTTEPRPSQVLTRRIQILVQGESREEIRSAWQKPTDPVHARRRGKITKRMQQCAKVLFFRWKPKGYL